MSGLEDAALEFRLTYEGPLTPDKNKGSPAQRGLRATEKQRIRKVFHAQLKRLWEIAPALVDNGDSNSFLVTQHPIDHMPAALAEKFKRGAYRYVPLVTREIEVSCSIDVLCLRADGPGALISAGDIDNRMKTLFDALAMPRDEGQLGEFKFPADGEDPFFCLLEDDSLLSRVTIETDTILKPVSDPPSLNDARVIITVRLGLLRLTPSNIHLG